MSESSKQRRNRIFLVLMFLLFAAPILGAFYLNSSWSDWAPAMTRNHGVLVQPVQPVPETLRSPDAPLNLADGSHWTVLLAADRCGEHCEALIHDLAAVHRALGRRGDRVQLSQVSASSERQWPAPELMKAAVAPSFDSFLTTRLDGDDVVFLVDPLGNLMMRYPPSFDPTGLRKDLQRLLKYSKVGT